MLSFEDYDTFSKNEDFWNKYILSPSGLFRIDVTSHTNGSSIAISMPNVQTTFGLLFQQFGLSQFRTGHNCFNGVESASFSKRNDKRTATLWTRLLRGWILISFIQALNAISPIYPHHRHLLLRSFSVMSVAKFHFNWNPLEICIVEVYYKNIRSFAKRAFSCFNDLTVDVLTFTNSG